MKYRELTAWAGVLALVALGSCVTSGDLQRITDKMEDFERVLDDPLATQEDLSEAIAATKEEVKAVAADVKDRTDTFGDTLLEQGGIAGAVTAAGLALLSAHRNKTREQTLVKKS